MPSGVRTTICSASFAGFAALDQSPWAYLNLVVLRNFTQQHMCTNIRKVLDLVLSFNYADLEPMWRPQPDVAAERWQGKDADLMLPYSSCTTIIFIGRLLGLNRLIENVIRANVRKQVANDDVELQRVFAAGPINLVVNTF